MKRELFLILSTGIVCVGLVACDKGAAPAALPSALASKEVRGQAIQRISGGVASNTAAKPLSAAPVAAAKTEEKIGEFLVIGFDRLAAFNYEMPDETPATATNKPPANAAPKDQIPANVRAFNNTKIALKGFMLPLKVEGGLITELLIMRDQSACCYGSVPKINEWVSVKMTGKGVKPIMDVPITLFGKLQVGEIRENGYLVGIYQMDGEKLGGPGEL